MALCQNNPFTTKILLKWRFNDGKNIDTGAAEINRALDWLVNEVDDVA